MSKILQSLLLVSLGGLLSTELLVYFVVRSYDNEQAVYNLYDHIIPFTVSFAVGVLFFGAGLLVIKMIQRKA